MSKDGNAADKPRVLGLSEVLTEEFALLHGEQAATLTEDPKEEAPAFSPNLALNNLRKDTAALCFSGGGIRSASFCLGAVQALARRGLLDKFHYLSTVSGGGYTGSLLSAWAYRAENGLDDVARGLRNPAAPQTPNPIAWLRQYCSYLAPRRGLLSTDTWTIVVTYLRNLFLNSLILIPFLMAAVTAPRWLASVMDGYSQWALAVTKQHMVAASLATSLAAWLIVVVLVRRFRSHAKGSERYAGKLWSRVIYSSAPVFAVAMTLGWMLEALGPTIDRTAYVGAALRGLGIWVPVSAQWAVGLGAVGAVLGLVHAIVYEPAPKTAQPLRARASVFIAHVTAGAVLGGGIAWFEHLFAFSDALDPRHFGNVLVFGPPFLIAALATAEAAYLGITSKLNDDYHREWWARLFGTMARWSLIWCVMGLIAFEGPRLVDMIADKIAYAGGLLASGAALARFAFKQGIAGKLTEEKVQTHFARFRQLLFVAAAYGFVALLLCMLSWVSDSVVKGELLGPWPIAAHYPPRALPYAFDHISYLMVGLFVVVSLASRFVNVNRFSLHSMYRDRLIRAFLGASRAAYSPLSADCLKAVDTERDEKRQFEPRKENKYTDFDRDDNPIMWWLSPGRLKDDVRQKQQKKLPFLVVNGALNLVNSKELAWQERKAASFVFTPLHVGSHLTRYAPSAEYCGSVGGVTLGTAMAISGAAVSPNAGYHSTPILTFLLTIFNARLGWWLGNPNNGKTRLDAGPRNALEPIVNELRGKTDAENEWVYISDGGHFDNLGLYEMVRRGCRFIVAVDASADPRFEYDSLGIAIRKIRIDFGIPILLGGSLRIGDKTLGEAGAHCSLFVIHYGERVGGEEMGYLLYVKASHYPRAPRSPVDLRQYAAGMSLFPHEPTSDQFFGESQFESYRALGEWEIEEITSFTESVTSVKQLFSLAYSHTVKFQGEKAAASAGPAPAPSAVPAPSTQTAATALK